MKTSKLLIGVTMALLNVALSTVAIAQDKATAQEVIAKVREAASTLSKTGDLAQFNQKQGPWVWKDTYVFVQDCDRMVVAAPPQARANRPRPWVHQEYEREEHLSGPGSPLRWSQEAFRRMDRVSVDEAGREGGLSKDQLLLECQRNPLRSGRWDL